MTNEKQTAPSPVAGEAIETTLDFVPRFGPDGLIPAIVTDVRSGEVLMFAHMNAQALDLTIATSIAHFWSRSRARIWKKGEESGNLLAVSEVRTDCDQDVVWLAVKVEGDGVACHTGAPSCFYRRVVRSGEKQQPAALEIAPLRGSPDAD